MATNVQNIAVGVFDAAAGGFTAELSTFATDADLMAFIVKTSQFQAQFPQETDAEFAAAFVAQVVPTATESGAAWAVSWLEAQLEAGASKAEVMLTAINALLAVEDDNADFGDAKLAFVNKVAAAEFLSADSTETDLAALQSSIANVTSDDATLAAITTAGSSFTLTTGADVFEGTAGNDTITGTNLTLLSGDIIVDTSSVDSDTLNLSVAAAPATAATTISGIETINVDSQLLTGNANDAFNATNTTGATINVSMSKFGNDGEAQITGLGDNSVVAGTGVETLTVTAVGDASISGGATTLNVTTAGTDDTVSIAVEGDTTLALNAAGDDTVTITGTEGTEIDLTGATIAAGDVITATGLNIAAAQLASGAELTAASADLVASATVTDWAVDSIVVSSDAGGAITLTNVADGQAVSVTAATANLLTLDGANGATTVTVSTGVDLSGLTTSTFSTTNVAVSADVALGTVTAAGDVVVSGTGDVTVTSGAGVTSLDASGLTGDLTLTANAATVEVLGSTGATTYTTSTATNTFTGQDGADDVTLGVLAAGTDRFVGQFGGGADTLTVSAAALANAPAVVAAMGAGNDTIELDDAATSATLTLDGGDGTDTLLVDSGIVLTGATLTLTSIENLQVAESGGALTIAAEGSQLDGGAFAISIADYDSSTLEITVTADEASLDLSGHSVDATQAAADAVSFVIDGNATATTIVGTGVNDSINTGNAGTAAAVSITTGGGSDTIVAVADDSSATEVLTITDFTIAATGDFDTLDLDTVGTSVATAVAAGDAVADFAAVFGDAVNAVSYDVADGVLSFTGTAADLALLDKVAEVASIAGTLLADTDGTSELLAFEFEGDTWVFEDDGNAAGSVLANVIQLTGVTGVDAISNTQAADTIAII